ncbi:CYTH and CHAD domain-containing protein [Acinetobacter sp. ANC 4641]|uniref:CYTH and CHAD domain-containing protein n=1 Tax=Acinetobacter sp. ANC 4641 TaxID=2529847 RepID=UPI00103C586C|nr:CHAD domain-containing protein [Acinetobacter sp. ANC 4641]TCB13428.1 CHAD domain-containing protein [Acinetobacter sp. ANC 4641]
MVEIELKFQVPMIHRVDVSQVFHNKNAQPIHVKTQYYDTAERKLSAANIKLNLVLHANHWVQTLICEDAKHLGYLEHQVNLGETDAPHVDVTLHRGTPAGTILFEVLGDETQTLTLQFETDIVRRLHNIEDRDSQIEVALDVGEIRTEKDHLPVYELKFELKTGSANRLFSLVTDWVQRYELWLDIRSKVALGGQLRQRLKALPAIQACNPVLIKKLPAEIALREMIASCLQQILPNVAEMMTETNEAEHVHQARVGIRRLRSVLRVFGHWSQQIDQTWEVTLKALFNQLGAIRDRDALEEKLLPKLRAAGASYLKLPAQVQSHQQGIQTFKDPSYTTLWLALIQFIQVPLDRQHQQHIDDNLTERVSAEIKHMHRQLLKDAASCLDVNDMMWHRTRKRVKRLRYCIEFVCSLYDQKQVRQYLKALNPVQDILGQYNDVLIAEALFKQQVQHHPQAWFALGWLAAHREQLRLESALALQQLQHAKIFW